MARENPPDLPIADWLKILGVELLCQWDVLVFLYRHLTSLASAEDIARLLGYPTSEVVVALDGLESLGLVERSRVDWGVRLYQFAAPADPRPGDALDRLLTLTGSRAGRLLLSKKLRRGNPPKQDDGLLHLHRKHSVNQLEIAVSPVFARRARLQKRVNRMFTLHRQEGSATWRKAI